MRMATNIQNVALYPVASWMATRHPRTPYPVEFWIAGLTKSSECRNVLFSER